MNDCKKWRSGWWNCSKPPLSARRLCLWKCILLNIQREQSERGPTAETWIINPPPLPPPLPSYRHCDGFSASKKCLGISMLNLLQRSILWSDLEMNNISSEYVIHIPLLGQSFYFVFFAETSIRSSDWKQQTFCCPRYFITITLNTEIQNITHVLFSTIYCTVHRQLLDYIL